MSLRLNASLLIALFVTFMVDLLYTLYTPHLYLLKFFIFQVFLPALIFLTAFIVYQANKSELKHFALSFSIFSVILFLINLYFFLKEFSEFGLVFNPAPLKLFAVIPVISACVYLYPRAWKYLRLRDLALVLLINSLAIIASFYPLTPITLSKFYVQPVAFIDSLLVFLAVMFASFLAAVYREEARKMLILSIIALELFFFSDIFSLYNVLLNLRIPAEMLIDLAYVFLFFGFYNAYAGKEMLSIDALERMVSEYQRRLENISSYKKFFDHAEDVFFRLDVKGRFVDVNPKIEILGYSRDEVLGRKSIKLISRTDRDQTIERFRSVLKGNREKFRVRAMKKTGEIIEMEVIEWPWREGNIFKGVEGIARDISDIVEAERNIRSLNEYLTVLNKILRHDIQNDLAVIKMYADLIREGEEIDLQTFLQKLDERIDHAISTIRDAREIEKMLKVGELVGVNLSAVLMKVIEEFNREARITYEIPEGVYVEADSAINSVIHNIIQNAIFHNDKEIPEIDVTVTEKGDRVYVRIADNGPGVPDEMKTLIFEENFKGETTGRSGLGLYLVKETMKRYGGRVWVEDNEPYGSVFVLEFVKSDISEDFLKISKTDLS
ncbi:MAG: PAS domain S-box protein [Archaeoglobus sp.]|nr:PAS domain S-box protein [Archaeoglobus sp.]